MNRWIFNGTIRQNIIFGKRYDKEKFEQVIKACSLVQVKILQII